MIANSFGFQGGTSGSSTSGVQSVTGLATDNTDPQNPVVNIAVDVSLTGQGTPASPLMVNASALSLVQSVTGLATDNTDPQNPVVNVAVDGVTITGQGTPASPLVAVKSGNRLATHILTKPRSQFYYSLALTNNSLNVGTYTQNQIVLSAFTPAYDLTINTFNFEVTTLFSGGLVKIAIYSDLNGVPNSKLLESVDVSTTTTGLKTITGFTFTFTAGTTYWIGAISNNSTAGFRTMSSTIWNQAPVIATSSSTQVYTSWLINSPYASLPSTLTTPTTSNLNTQGLLYIVFRAV